MNRSLVGTAVISARIPRCLGLLCLLGLLSLGGCAGTGGGGSPLAYDAARAAALRVAEPFSMGGAWSGLFMSGVEFVKVDLELEAEPASTGGEGSVQETFHGTATYTTWFVSGPPARGSRVSTSSAKVRVLHQAAAGTFTVEPQEILTGGVGSHARSFRSIRGVVDRRHHRLAGIHGDSLRSFSQCFRFTRPEEFGATEAAYRRFAGPGPKIRRLAAGTPRNSRENLQLLFGGGPDKPDPVTVLKWSRRLAKDVVSRNGRSSNAVGVTGFQQNELMLLFEDAHFSQAFGVPFDGLSDSAMDGVYALLFQDFRNSGDAEEKSVSSLAQRFKRSDLGAPTGVHTLQAVLSLRTLRYWLDERSEHLAGLPAGEEGWAIVKGLESELESPLAGLFWRQQIEVGIETADFGAKAQAAAALARGLDLLEQAPLTRETLRTLQDWPFRKADDMRWLSTADRQALGERNLALMDRILDELLEPHRASMPALGASGAESPLDTARAGALWHEDLQLAFQRSWSRPPLERLREQFLAARAQVLVAARQEMVGQVRGLKLTQLPLLQGAWFSVPGDDASEAYGAVLAAAEQRHDTIDAAIRAAEDRARELVRDNRSRPLPFLDVRRYDVPTFLEFAYYGDAPNVNSEELIEAWLRGDARTMLAKANVLQHLQTAFRIYHGLYQERYGKTEVQRVARLESHGEDWRAIVSTWVEKDDYGNVIDRNELGVSTYVRAQYGEKYIECEQTEGNLWGALFLGALASGQGDQAAASDVKDIFALSGLNLDGESPSWGGGRSGPDGLKASRKDYGKLFAQFLDEHQEERIATVRHLERNLMAMVSGKPLTRLERLEVDGL